MHSPARPARPVRAVQRSRLAGTLLHLADLLAKDGSPADILRRAVERIPAMLQVDMAVLLRRDGAGELDRLIAEAGIAEGSRDLIEQPLTGEETAELSAAAETLGFCQFDGLSACTPLQRRLLDSLTSQRVAVLPLRYGGGRVGLLLLGVCDPGEFTAAELGLARGIADQLSVAVATSRLREENARRTRELAALHSAALATGGALDVDTAMRSICDQAARAFDADGAAILLLNDAGTHLCGAHLGGEGRTERQIALWRNVRVPVGPSARTDKGWRTGGTSIVTDMDILAPESMRIARKLGLRSLLTVSLRVEGLPGGLLAVGDRRPGVFSRADVPLAEALAEHAATAIARARAYAEALAREEQTHFHATLLAHVSDAVIAIDRRGRVTYWNAGAERLYGWTAAEMLGRSPERIVPDRLRPAEGDTEGMAPDDPTVFSGEHTHRHRDGGELLVESRAAILRDAQGNPTGMLCISQDITDRRRAEHELARSTRRILAQKTELEGIIAHLGDGLMLADTERRVVLINPAAYAMLDIDPADAGPLHPESHFWHVVARDGAPLAAADLPLARALAGDRGPARDLEIVAGGETRVISVSAAPLTTPEGALHGAVALLRDVTETRRSQDRVVESERLRALGEMASGVAHDFNNLLGVILGRCELVLQPAPGAETGWDVRPHLDVVKQAALDGAETVKRLQAFSGVSRVTTDEAMDLGRIVNDVVEFTRPRWKDAAQQRGITIQVSTAVAPLPLIQGSPAELREVLLNLVFNAVDAMPHGGTIMLAARRHGDEVQIQVQDDGIGMTETVRRRAFEPFFSTKGTSGAGLGLSMSYGIVSRMGGRLEVESALYAGTCFTITLPFRPVDARQAPGTEHECRPLTVMLVDDEPQMLRTTALMLELDGHTVTGATSGSEALIRLHERGGVNHPYDAILTDLGMPGMNGIQLIAALRSAGIRTPCVLVTGWGNEVSDDDLRASGAAAVLPKPFSAAQLRAVLATLSPGPM